MAKSTCEYCDHTPRPTLVIAAGWEEAAGGRVEHLTPLVLDGEVVARGPQVRTLEEARAEAEVLRAQYGIPAFHPVYTIESLVKV